jgi:hypothetical protein
MPAFDPDYAGETDVILAPDLGTYDGCPVRYMDVDALVQQGKDHTFVCYVWPHEGEPKKGKFVFHKGEITDAKGHTSPAPKTPLAVDATSARAFMLVYEAINDANKAKMRGWTEEHRGLFVGLVMDRLVWPNVGFRK